MLRGMPFALVGAALSAAFAFAAAADPGNGNGNGGVGNGNGNGNDAHVTAPEIHTAGLAAGAAIVLGGVALITARSGGRKPRVTNE